MKLKIIAEEINTEVAAEIKQLFTSSIFDGARICIFPNIHMKDGTLSGFTLSGFSHIVPSLLGTDIGDGILAVRVGKDCPDLPSLDAAIRNTIPCGNNVNGIADEKGRYYVGMLRCRTEIPMAERLANSIGTLGSGGHFIELGIDEEGFYWLVIHAGSGRLGQEIAKVYVRKADRYSENRKREKDEPSWLSTDDAVDFLWDCDVAKKFANTNRHKIMERIHAKLPALFVTDKISSVHNEIEISDPANPIIRCGAVDASKETRLILPLTMKHGCLIGKGKGNEYWDKSAPNGLGRRLTKEEARKILLLQEYERAMKGIYSSSVARCTLDESPKAYKQPETLLSQIDEIMKIQNRLTPVYNFKAH